MQLQQGGGGPSAAMCYLRLPMPDVIDEAWHSAFAPAATNANSAAKGAAAGSSSSSSSVPSAGDDRREKERKQKIEEQKRRGPSEEGWLATFDKLFDFVENAMRLNGAVRKEAKRNEKKKQNCSGARVRTLSSKLLTSSRQINPLVNSKLL